MLTGSSLIRIWPSSAGTTRKGCASGLSSRRRSRQQRVHFTALNIEIDVIVGDHAGKRLTIPQSSTF